MAEVMRNYAGLNLGTADVSVIAIAEHYGTTTIATIDHRDFRAITPSNSSYFNLAPRSPDLGEVFERRYRGRVEE